MENEFEFEINYDQDLNRRVSEILFNILLAIPIISLVIALMNFMIGDFIVTGIVLSTIPFSLLCIWVLRFKNDIKLTMSILIAQLLLISISACTFGIGVHDIGITLLPVIIVLSSLVLRPRGILMTVIGSLLGVVWLTLGEEYGLYQPNYNNSTGVISLIVVFSILSSYLFISYSLVRATKKGLDDTRLEVRNQLKVQTKIADNLELKTQLLQQIHHRVKNNLALINSIIDMKMFNYPEAKPLLQGLQERMETVARAHDPLYHTDDYKEVALKPYFEKMLTTFMMSSNNYSIKYDLADGFVYHENALSAGIFLQEGLSLFNQIENSQLHIRTNMKNKVLEVTVDSSISFTESIEDRLEVMLLKLISENNQAPLKISSNSASITLNVKNPHEPNFD